ncbi:MAG: glycoside hydrolase [Burkholderiales bacterium]|nr:glycoside hydrolase [Burkholderiales bacterium]
MRRAPAAGPLAPADLAMLDTCRREAVALLRANLTPDGVLAAAPGARARSRGYTSIFGRDAAVCALGMALSGDPELERAAPAGLATLARHQAGNGQLPKFVDPARAEADFWYLGCIDATLWWLAAAAFLDARDPELRLRARHAPAVARAIAWLHAQEHQRFFLLQQNEASDWADIMPRSGFVLYTNALWYWVKRLYGLPRAQATRASANQLFRPFDAPLAEYRRARLLVHYAKRRARNRGLYLSFANFAFFGDEGDVFGNVLAVLCGLADGSTALAVLRALERAGVADPYPVRAVCDPIRESSVLWRPYMSRHRQNLAWQYHNGGVWPFVGAFWVVALAAAGQRERGAHELAKVARANALGGWQFNEWLHGRTLAPAGMPRQSWNAAAFLLAWRAVFDGARPFAVPPTGATGGAARAI